MLYASSLKFAVDNIPPAIKSRALPPDIFRVFRLTEFHELEDGARLVMLGNAARGAKVGAEAHAPYHVQRLAPSNKT